MAEAAGGGGTASEVGVCACVVLLRRRFWWTILQGADCGCTSRSLSVRCVRWGSALGAMGGGAGVGSGCICIGGRGGGRVE